jgi:diadenosine tetraphosphatase ApaH/serine/threonine PP2A family protein phosphatase
MSTTPRAQRLAAFGGAYGNLAALDACLSDAAQRGADVRAFLGDAIGCCGHSDEVVAKIRERFDVLVAGNHEQQAAARADGCGCGYSSPDDEAVSCEAFRLATSALSDETRAWLGTWPDRAVVEMEGGSVLLCHGSPGNTNEFLYESELDDLRLEAWLDWFGVRGFVCTHSGLPWVRRLRGGRFAVNCGVVGKPDHDGDPAVHYAHIECREGAEPVIEIRRVAYDHEAWARRMEEVGIAPIFVEPVRTGVWTTGIASLPIAERHRHLRAREHASSPLPARRAWEPEMLRRSAFETTLAAFRDLGLLAQPEVDEILALLDPGFPFFAPARLADSVHAHVRVDDVAKLPRAAILALGGRPENEREGYAKFSFAGGINLIFSHIDVAEEDRLPEPSARRARPFLDHVGLDLRREIGVVRAAFEDAPEIARRAGWAHVAQGGAGRAVYCCHVEVAAKHWVYPPPEGSRWTRPVELAFGSLQIHGEAQGCDLRPIDPRHPDAAAVAACAAARDSAAHAAL